MIAATIAAVMAILSARRCADHPGNGDSRNHKRRNMAHRRGTCRFSIDVTGHDDLLDDRRN
jgi:hypothetical protein